MKRTISYITLAVVLGLVSNSAITSLAFGQEEPQQTHTWIFVTGPAKYCDENTQVLSDYISSATAYLAYIGRHDIVCFPSAGDVMNVRDNVELIRTLYPDDKMVFTYDLRNPAKDRDFKLFLGTVDSFNHKNSLGKAFISEGWAVSAFSGEVAAHELAHLTTHKDHPPGTDMNDPATWR
ncbi:hypothetical protein [Candidatus Nitrososphaera evergladensis]|nr:hypothetical protein [Candidatus Nitrososphaera evergladensis]